MSRPLVIFDCDGVLVDSEALMVEHEARALTEAGFPLSPSDIAEMFLGLTYADMRLAIEQVFGMPMPAELLEEVQASALARFPDELRAVPGIDALLSDMEGPFCLASSSALHRIELSLEVTDLRRHFSDDRVFSAQMVDRGKPAPDLFLHAARSCDTPPDRCVVVEDSPHGVTASVAAGMPVLGFTGGGHATATLGDRLRDAGASEIADSAEALSQLLTE